VAEQHQRLSGKELDPTALLAFVDDLRGAGLTIGVDQYLAVIDLVAALIVRGVNLRDPEILTQHLAPLLAKSVDESQTLRSRLHRRMNVLFPVSSATGAPPIGQSEDTEQPVSPDLPWRRGYLQLAFTVVTLILIAAIFSPTESTTESIVEIEGTGTVEVNAQQLTPVAVTTI